MNRSLASMILIGLATAAAMGVPSATAAGRTFYVSPTGNDAHPGSAEQPWASPGYGSRQLQPGDTLILRAGRYVLSRYDEDILMPRSGRPDAWVTIRGEEGQRPLLAGRDDLMAAIVLDGRSYVRIENLEICPDDQVPRNRRRFREGVHLTDKPGSHIVLASLYVHHVDHGGLNLQDVQHLLMWNCLIEYCGGGAVGGPAGVHGGWRHVLIQNCELSHSGHYFQGGDGSTRPYDRPDGFGIEPSAGPVEISHTIVRHNRGDGLDSKAANTYIHNCIVANNSCDGIKLWGTGSKVENCLVYGTGDGEQGRSAWSGIVIHNEEQDNAQFELLNVTLHDDPRHENYQMYVQYGIARPLRLIVRNCVFGGGYGAVHFGETVRLTAEHNLFHRAGGETPVHVGEREYTAAEIERGALGPGNLSRDPQFRRPAWGREGDYRLQPGSPCIDAGTSRQAPAADLDGTSRPRGRAVDLGCYEFQKSPG